MGVVHFHDFRAAGGRTKAFLQKALHVNVQYVQDNKPPNNEFPTRRKAAAAHVPRRIPVSFAHPAAVEDPAHHLAVLTGKDAVRQAAAKQQKHPKILQK